ncbi:MAG: heparinase II/III family protein, partial [Lentisphaeria bacterium]|nr:heparinase II/III family protein [Lentisphaeria bacterium]
NIELNAYGHFAIGRGQGLNGIQAHLHFCPFTQMSHYHRDKLSLILFGAGEELLSDTGYVHVRGKNRYFANSSLSHNTVTVEYDSPDKPLVLVKPGPEFIGTVERPKWAAMRNRPLQEARSTLIAYDPGVRGEKNVQLIAASVPGNSRSRLTHRTRELLLIALDENRSCLLDIFRVQGGVRQNFVLRPSCDEDVLAENCSLELGPERAGTLAGENLRYDEIPADRDNIIPYSWLVHRIRTADAESDWTLTWRGADSGSRLQAFIAGVENAEAWLGQSPSLRRARNNGKRADDFQNPHLLLRRPEDGGGITFAAVYECVPGNEQGAIRSVAFRWPEGNSSTAPLEVTIQMADGEIHVTANCLPIDGAARMVPSYSVAAELGGHAVWRWQWGKSRKRTRLALRTVYRTAAGDACNGFLVDGTIGGNAVLPGEWVRLVYGDERAYGYQVEKIVHQGKSTLVQIAGDPGIKKTGTGIELMYFPFYNTTGSPWIELPPATFAKHPVE